MTNNTQKLQEFHTKLTCMRGHVSLKLGGEVESLVTEIALELAFTSMTLVSLVSQERVTVGEQSPT